ncbi:MAG: cysteine hydrolase [Pseudomonadales bacterium]|nr:cysteine hydrolase [Pseudomonadales bacterium]
MKIYKDMDKVNTALLVIDPVNSCAHEKCETPEWNIYFSKIRKMLPKLDEFVKRYRKEVGGLVVLTTITPWTKEHLPDNLNELYTDPEAEYYSEDATGFDEEFYTVKPEKSDFVIAKNTYDAFTNEDLLKKLKEKGIRYIVIAGIFSDGCVLASVVSGFAKGFNFVILKDLIETTDDKTRQELQKLLIKFTFPKMYGKTITSDELLKELK